MKARNKEKKEIPTFHLDLTTRITQLQIKPTNDGSHCLHLERVD
jgi:hypothetical protein